MGNCTILDSENGGLLRGKEEIRGGLEESGNDIEAMRF